MAEGILSQGLGLSRLSLKKKYKGAICKGTAYETDYGEIFVKKYPDRSIAKVMFDGEFAGLEAMQKTDTVRVPNPIRVIDHPDGCLLVMEHMKMKPLEVHLKELGRKLALMHASNAAAEARLKRREKFVGQAEPSGVVTKFGFDVVTCRGRFPMPNEWCGDWLEFFVRNRLQILMDIVQQQYNDREVRELWPQVLRKLPKVFPASLVIKPALLHGDFWYGNTGDLDSEPCIFDPSALYGHSEFEISMPQVFDMFPTEFYDEYHKIIPKAEGWEQRQDVYNLFKMVNQWNHFGPEKKSREMSIGLMRIISKL